MRYAAPMVERDEGPPQVRPCGGCQVCCQVLEVAALKKPAWSTCTHQDRFGCSIHPTRPFICRGFACNWAMGDPRLPERMRPDHAGLLIWVGEGPMGLTVFVHVLWEGALERPELQEALAFYRRTTPMVIENLDGTVTVHRPAGSWPPA